MNRRQFKLCSVSAMAAATLVVSISAQTGIPPGQQVTLAIGASAPSFALPGVDGKLHKFSDYGGAKVLAVVFQCISCPVSQLYESRIERLYQDYRDRGVALVAIDPNNAVSTRLDEQSYTDLADSLDGMKERAQYRHLDYPFLYDGEAQAAAGKYGPSSTPQIFIFDQDRKLRYAGRIDDNVRESLVESRDARDVIDGLLAGKPVLNHSTAAVSGCPIRWLSHTGAVAEEKSKIEAEPVDVTLAGAADLATLRGNPSGKLLLINFWATWCGPCISEFSDLQDTYRMYRSRGLDFVTVSENNPNEKAAVLKVLQRYHVSTKNLLFATSDTSTLQEAFDHNLGAAVPYTLVLTHDGDVVYQEEGAITILALRRAILERLPDTRQYPGQQEYWSAK